MNSICSWTNVYL